MSLRVSKPGFNIREKLNELDRPIGVQGNNILRSNTASESFDIIQAGRRNMIINGDMSVAQRGVYIDANTPSRTTGITGDTFGGCDRWELDISNSGTWTQEQVKDAPLGSGFHYSSKMTCTTANTAGGGNTPGNLVSLRQKIEWGVEKSLSHNTTKAKPFTVSFWVKSNEPGKYYVQAININTTTANRISRSYTIEQSGVWEFKTLIFPPPTIGYPHSDMTVQGLEIYFTVGANSNTYGSPHYGTWSTNVAYLFRGQTNLAAATGNYFQVTGVQLEKGSQNTPFEHLHYTENLALCQRYCMAYGGDDEVHLGTAHAYNSTNINLSVHLPVSLRTKPGAFVTTAPTGGDAGNWVQAYVGASGVKSNAGVSVGESTHSLNESAGGVHSLRLYLSSAHSGLSAGQALWVHTLVGAKLVLDAEL
tara:strand:- start:595 stop:1854 length:1260 start_codon:yes stop_codon:yes gene_type:complete